MRDKAHARPAGSRIFATFHVLTSVILLAFTAPGRAESTNSFALYLTAESLDSRIIFKGTGDWSKVRLQEKPLFSSADIVSYDPVKHALRLKPEALTRLPKARVQGTPFVVVANGERVYLGVFTTLLSSMSFAVPSIVVDRRIYKTNQPPDTLIIERAYPGESFGSGPDPRGDPRIRAALESSGKLKPNPANSSTTTGNTGPPNP